MPSKHTAAVAAILLSLAAVSYGLVRTAGEPAVSGAAHSAGEDVPAVDGRSLAIAQRLVRLPTTPDERHLAEDALRLGDKEMDLAFADAVRDVAIHPRALTPEMKAVTARLRAARAELASDKAEADALTDRAAHASGAARAALDDQVNLAKAHLELVDDEVDDAAQDLQRAGGDPQGRMQEMMREHDELSKSSDSTRIELVAPVERRGLLRHAQAWFALDRKRDQLIAAAAAAQAAAADFARRHDVLESTMHAADHDSVRSTLTHEASAALLLDTQRQAVAQKTRGTLDQHVENQRHLAEVYGQWSDVVAAQQRHEVNRGLRALAVILGIVLLGVLLDRAFERAFVRVSVDRRRTRNLYMVVRTGIQVTGVVLILLVICGLPGNIGTFIGLAGAGLTVALKDFIIGFCGWFILMGRDGIGIGDVVEINGVTGEVQEVGMFHTVLLETGNWVDSGHQTGRRVTFSNSFAVEKHYFNFTTHGRWLWDEVRFVIPAGRDQSYIVDQIRAQVHAMTDDTAARAEAELRIARRGARMSAISTAPAIHFKPIVGGVEVTVRYLTQVRERAEVRSQLYGMAITLLNQPVVAVPAPVLAGAAV